MDPQRVTVPAFDVFVSYNSKNRAEVTRLARNLAGLGVRVWFDRSCLTPGGDWQLELAEGLAGSSACAVCVGPEDLGAWTRMEASAALNRASRDNEFRVFPVLLPGVVKFRPASLPPFLATRTWVDSAPVDAERGEDRERDLVAPRRSESANATYPTAASATARAPYFRALPARTRARSPVRRPPLASLRPGGSSPYRRCGRCDPRPGRLPRLLSAA